MKVLAAILGGAGLSAAHGYIDNGTIGGQFYEFYQINSDPWTNPRPERISRPVQGNGPVENVDYADLQCGGYTDGGVVGSEPAKLHATAPAGSTNTLRWTLWPESHMGPVITYMARCPDSGCQDYMPGDAAVWFKIHEDGREGTINVWGDEELKTAPNDGYKYTIPSCLKPGYYIVRNEIIALHAAWQYPGAQFYPGCHQVEVTGSGTVVPSTNLVSFPGAYKGSDPGVTYDAYKAQPYTIPGPPVFKC
ncbi:hypothetical protein DL764_008586 [Monosporascus ibericus]|uniref:lytic cellulose monooxygenase (C4-dehydrogenating) n=1 Tax=Monosporascus ibericus TaxID=155417 RepID=A0A4Q4SZD2_9PEZI|nr:hypothetical protein DL764_008586 [Monosporascus ibericus]